MERILDFGNSFLTTQARGLHNFIAEIRNCTTKDQERTRVDQELANIRQKFSSVANLNAHQKKKYVTKLCYIYMLGYEVEFGHLEFISLLSSTKFQEKAVGYLAFSLMLRSNDELMTLVVNSMRNDIISPYHYAQTLALAAAANLGGANLAEALASDVQRIIVHQVENPTSHAVTEEGLKIRNVVLKKALLCLLRLYRASPDSITMDPWTKYLGKLLGDRDMGVLTSVMSLLNGFVAHNPAQFEALVPFVLSVLNRLVVQRTCPADYHYYRIPSPWLHVKCLRFLQYYAIPTDKVQLELVTEIITKILHKVDVNESSNKSNADHSILFEAINLLLAWGPDAPPELKDVAGMALGRFIGGKDANIRYLGLEALTRLAKLDGAEAVQMHQSSVVDSLKDADISVRKRSLNLLFAMTNSTNAKEVVAELIVNLDIAESNIKEDIVVKIALLAEKFTSDFAWYVNTMIQVILAAGDFIAEAVWFRVVQVITNNTDIHEFAAERLLGTVQSKWAHETIVAVAGYMLGEIGVNICDRPGSTGYDQFAALHQHFANVSEKVQCILLTTYVKMYNLYPDVRDLIGDVFTKCSTSSNLELQQRACEYMQLPQVDAATMEAVLNTMPVYEIDDHNILNALAADQSDQDRAARAERSGSVGNDGGAAEGEERSDEEERPSSKSVANATKSLDLLGMSDEEGDSSIAHGGGGPPGGEQGIPGSMEATLKKCFLQAVLAKEKAVLFENESVRVSQFAEYRMFQGRIAIEVQNKHSSADVHSLQVNVEPNPADGTALRFKQQALASSRLSAGESTRTNFAVDCSQPFSAVPKLEIVYSCNGANHRLPLQFPVTVSGFLQPFPTDKASYMERWKSISGEGTEQQCVFSSGKAVDASLLNHIKTSLLPNMRLAMAEGLDSEKTATSSANFLMSGGAEPLPVLMRLESDAAQQKFRVTIRAGDAKVAAAMKALIVGLLSMQ